GGINMNHGARFALSSVTYAMQARDLLSKYGIRTTIVRLHPSETPNGCAFGLEVMPRDISSASAVLTKAQIKFTRI
ncbi:MAG: DUF3343 domain-containing protein, partial [Clostridia bacterium]|nr:DUF3343 domain-containing protein [Clostridia bacterium]